MDIQPPKPPPLPPQLSDRGKFFRTCANLSWLSIILCIATYMFLNGVYFSTRQASPPGVVIGAVVLLFLFGGLASGIIGLSGIPRYGRKGLLAPSLTGILIWVSLIAVNPLMSTVRALKAAEMEATRTVLRPAQHAPDEKRFHDEELGFSFDIPVGFMPFDVSKSAGEFKHGFMTSEKSLNSFVLISPMGRSLDRRHLTMDQLPAGSKASGITIQSFDWRGIGVDATRVPEYISGCPYITYNVQIPLRKEAIQIRFSGPKYTEEAIRTRAVQVLNSLDGESNW